MDTETRVRAEAQADLCGIFSNAHRVLILWALADQEMSVGEIATEVNASLQNTSRHLHLMKDKGLLASHREGQTVFYRVINHELLEQFGFLPAPRRKSSAREEQPILSF